MLYPFGNGRFGTGSGAFTGGSITVSLGGSTWMAKTVQEMNKINDWPIPKERATKCTTS